jgi:hypothetical protein
MAAVLALSVKHSVVDTLAIATLDEDMLDLGPLPK